MNKTEETCIRECANVDLINQGIKDIKMMEEQFSKVAGRMNLLGNANRLKIIYLIDANEKVCVCDLSDILDISVSAISQQLKKMKGGGILVSTKSAQTIFYEISNDFSPIWEQMRDSFDFKKLTNKVA